MKKILFSLFLFAIANVSFAQSFLAKGDNQINVGVGFSSWGLPVYLGFDHSVSNDITLGAEISFRSFNENFKNVGYRHSVLGISGNGNYHFNRVLSIPSKYDFYAGLNIGFYSFIGITGYNGDYNSGLGLGAQIGGRYTLSKKTSLNLEFGGGNSFSGGKLGLTFKL